MFCLFKEFLFVAASEMLRPFTDVEWAHIDDLLGTGPRPNVVGAWLWLTKQMEISRRTFESRVRVRS
jgi:hypothetical protein